MYAKFKRMRAYMKCEVFARVNQRSGESADHEAKKAGELWKKNHGPRDFPYMEEYKVLKHFEKWRTDDAHEFSETSRRAGEAQETPVKARLQRVAEESPTSQNTDKPLGVKKARVVQGNLAGVEKAKADEEKKI